MDLLSVLDQRHRDESSEARMAKNAFWCGILWSLGFLFVSILTAPAGHPSLSGSFTGTLLSMVYLMCMAGVYASMMRAAHSLSALRLPGPGGVISQLRFLLPSIDHGRGAGRLHLWFYGLFVSACLIGFSSQSFFFFAAALLGFTGCFAVYIYPLYG